MFSIIMAACLLLKLVRIFMHISFNQLEQDDDQANLNLLSKQTLPVVRG